MAEDPGVRSPAGVDRVCERLFLARDIRGQETNLKEVERQILGRSKDIADILDLYRRIRRLRLARVRDDPRNPLVGVLRISGITRVLEGFLWVRNDPRNPLVGVLRISGITRVLQGFLWVRNRIYYRVFDREWIRANTPNAEQRRQRRAFLKGFATAAAIASLVIALIVWFGLQAYWNRKWAEVNEDAAEGILTMTDSSINKFVNERNSIYKIKFSNNGLIDKYLNSVLEKEYGKLVKLGLRKSVENYEKLPAMQRETTLFNRVLSAMHDDIGEIEFDSGKYELAEKSYRNAIRYQWTACNLADKHIGLLYRKVWPESYTLKTYKYEIDKYYKHLLICQIRMGRDSEARMASRSDRENASMSPRSSTTSHAPWRGVHPVQTGAGLMGMV